MTPLLLVSLVTRRLSPVVVVSKMCGELIGVGQNALLRDLLYVWPSVGSVSLPTDSGCRSNPTPYRHFTEFVTAWLLAMNTSVVQMPLPLKNLLYSQQSLPFASSYMYGFPCLSNKRKSRRKSQNQQKFQCSRRPTVSNQQSATNQHRVFDVICKCIVGQLQNGLSRPKPNTSH